MPELTVLIYTAQRDFPYAGKAESWHCFEPSLRTLADQTFKDFEVVLVDAHWEKRSDWFATHPQPFPVKHVPASPNYWHERKLPGLAAQLNRGIAWADGRYIWMGGENNLFPPHHLALAMEMFRDGKLPSAWYVISDRMEGTAEARNEVSGSPWPKVSYNLHGFTQDDVKSVDHRAARFVTDPNVMISPCHEYNFFNYSGFPVEAALKINGFDELMDGIMSLLDCDFGGRLAAGGYRDMVMHRNLYVVEPPVKSVSSAEGYGGITRQAPLQCNYAILLHSKFTNRRANTPLPAGYAEDVRNRVCRDGGVCPIKDKCKGGLIGESKQYPFCGGEREADALAWHAVAPVRDLAAERELRKQCQPPYDRAFIKG